MLLAMRRASSRKHFSHVLQKIRIWVMMILSSPASSTRRNAGSEAVKVLKTHLPKVINELLCEPTVDDVLDHMHRDLREIGVEDFGVFRFTFEGLPLEKWLLGARVEKGKLARHVYKGELQASPVFRHCNEALEPFFWYDTPHEPYDDERFKRAREDGVPEALVVPVPGPKGSIGVGWFGSATNSRSELLKHRFTIQVICMAGFYRLKDLVAPPDEPIQSRLSKREREILVGVAKGMSSEEIGHMLHLSDRTVDWHIEQAIKTLDAKNRVQAVVLAMQKGALTI
jgi:DNA-binding CsgD family transcriptional regulator